MRYKMPTKAIITDAGYASRFLPITKTIPKGMLPIWDVPVMQLAVEECAQAGIVDIIIVTTPEGKPIYEDYFNNGATRIRKQLRSQGKTDRFEKVNHVLNFPKISIIEQDQALPYGNGSPLVTAYKRDFIFPDEAFVVLYSDDVVFGSSDVATLLEAYAKHSDAAGVIMTQEIDENQVDKYGIVKLKNGNLLDNIVEKPEIGKAPSTLASYGRYLLTPEIFEYLKPNAIGKDRELWTVDAITKLAMQKPVYVERTDGRWRTTGDPENYCRAMLSYVHDHDEACYDRLRDYIIKR